MEFQKNGIMVSVADDEVRRLLVERLSDTPEKSPLYFATSLPPRVGEVWASQGGVYAGIARGRDGDRDAHLIVGPEYDGTADWSASLMWAAGIREHAFSDYGLPYRKEQALCFANVPELFKPESYWSCEQRASDSDCAWGQFFRDGGQGYWGKGDKLRARAVRRLKL